MLNKYQWQNYLVSGGEKTVKIFEDVLEYKNVFEYASKIKELVSVYCPFDFRCDRLEEDLIDLLKQLPTEKSLQNNEKLITMDSLYREIEEETEYNGKILRLLCLGSVVPIPVQEI